MTRFRRLLVVAASVGWIIPFTLSFWAIYDFLTLALLPTVTGGKVLLMSWHLFSEADTLFYFAMAWLAAVITGWSLVLTRQR